MWQLWSLAKATATRPSELTGVEDRYLAYCLDEAVTYLGRAVEADLETITHKKPKIQQRRREARLMFLMGQNQADNPGRFRAPGS